MSWYAILELLHVACAIIWVGGGLTLMVAAEIQRRKRGPAAMIPVIEIVALLGPPLFVPVSALTVVFGAATAWMGGVFPHLWVMLGLAGFAATALNGLLMIKPRAERLSAMVAEKGPGDPDLVPLIENLLAIARLDYVLLALVVADMVLQPAINDLLELATMGAILVIGASISLSGVVRREPVAA